MQFIPVFDPPWQMTFPHRVAPLPGEWLPGLLLRCDEVNHWDSGTTVAHLFRSLRRTQVRGKTTWIVVPLSIMECFAHLLAISTTTLLPTTYHIELAHLYGPFSPHSSQLGRTGSFHFCPACFSEKRLLMRTVVLPHITLCPQHHLLLVDTCCCGDLLQLFSESAPPFVCQRCGVYWEHLSKVRASAERIELERKVLAWYAFFFTEATPRKLASALYRVRLYLKQEKESQVKCLDGRIKAVEHYELTKASLGYLIDLLVSLDLAPSEEA